jgi:hypothetical protein
MQIDTELSVITVDGNKLAQIEFEFSDVKGADAIVDFDPDKILLADGDSDTHFDLVDSEGFSYAKIMRSDTWVEAALEAGYFVLSMRTPLPIRGLVGGRLLLVSFPFGEVLRDSGTFSVKKSDLERADPEGLFRNRVANALTALSERHRYTGN